MSIGVNISISLVFFCRFRIFAFPFLAFFSSYIYIYIFLLVFHFTMFIIFLSFFRLSNFSPVSLSSVTPMYLWHVFHLVTTARLVANELMCDTQPINQPTSQS